MKTVDEIKSMMSDYKSAIMGNRVSEARYLENSLFTGVTLTTLLDELEAERARADAAEKRANRLRTTLWEVLHDLGNMRLFLKKRLYEQLDGAAVLSIGSIEDALKLDEPTATLDDSK